MNTASKKTKKSQTKKVGLYLYKVRGIAFSNKKYRWAIDIFEKYKRTYSFSDNQMYSLAMLYDHLVMFNKSKGMKKHKADEYLRKAESIYQSILERNPKFFFALHGIGRVWNIRGNYKKALYYQKRAYRLMLKQPRAERGALPVGHLYEAMGDYKKAEERYKKEYSDLKNDFGVTMNLFSFYKRRRDYEKALLYLPKFEHLLEKEFKKKVYRGLEMKKSKFLKSILKELEEVKRWKGSC